MFLLYDLIFILFACLYFSYAIVKGKWHKEFLSRFGSFPPALQQTISQRKNIWIHAVSVGEVIAVLGLIEKIKNDFPGHRIVLSTVTKTGSSVARSRLSKDDIIIYAPFDFSLAVRKYIRLIKPKIYITAETEIWPNLFLALSRGNVPIVQVNGRISDKAYSGYKMVRFLLKGIIRQVKVFCMQSQLDADRIMALGALPGSVRVAGNIKFDDMPQKAGGELQGLGLRDDEPLWIAGSTHPGEESIVLDIFKDIKKEFPDLRLVIAPRHVERAADVGSLASGQGMKPVFLSQFLEGKDTALTADTVLVVDKIGYLRSLYGLAKIVFVGKSLAVGGGQNIIEPAFFGKPVLVGPKMENFKDVVRLFLQAEGIIQVKDADELSVKIKDLLKNPQKRHALGSRALEVIEKNQGATEKTRQIISDVMAGRDT